MTDQDREKKIAEIQEALECYFEAWSENTNPFAAHCQFLLSELERAREENRKLREERDEWGRTAQEAINTVFVREHQLQSAQQDKEKLIEGLQNARKELEHLRRENQNWERENDAYAGGEFYAYTVALELICDTLKAVRVEVDG